MIGPPPEKPKSKRIGIVNPSTFDAIDPENVTGKYILDGHKDPVECMSLMMWCAWMEWARRHGKLQVGVDKVLKRFTVSTVFLGLDHRFGDTGPPILFETMVFDELEQKVNPGEELGGATVRYATWQEADIGHKKIAADLEIVYG